jgi:carboxylate-amine ligase
VHCLAVHLAERHAGGEPLPDAPTWRIAENRSAALRRGLDANLADLASGRPEPARERLARLLGELGPVASRLGCADQLAEVKDRLTRETAAATHRAVAAERGVRGLAAWLADRFLEGAVPGEG